MFTGIIEHTGTIEALDLENDGNPLVEPVGWLIRLARRPGQRMAGFIGKTAEALKARLKGFDVL